MDSYSRLGLQELEMTLGQQEMKYFLEQSIPCFRDNLAILLKALDSQKWQELEVMAHKMQATALIFSTPDFNAGLDSILQKDRALVETAVFRSMLETEAEQSLQKICEKYQIT